YGVKTNLFSVTSWVELAREGARLNKEALQHGTEPEKPFVTSQLENVDGPYVAVSDFVSDLHEQIRPYVPGTYITLGTDGFGFADTRAAARRYFNTDAESVVVAVLEGLAREGKVERSVVEKAAKDLKLDDPTATVDTTEAPGIE
ncbi:MAG: pyruvate dehydrogenase (acetyl-transferring), homodimeric type, partial [Alteromonadaceae bacterium]|nr:pyruvate dehydrogenase (acetyl-transferring), homodimeric type [Alteromonadaceae bacterium]